MSIVAHTTAATSRPGMMLTRNSQCHENISVRKPPIVGPKVEDRFRMIEIITSIAGSFGPRNRV
jgi:hypothetical protein